ncbi:superkiller complex protein 8-like [Achroia grisella]|uniref:superkiller complex protein 8-like n=1 Tax=Achroia grisella TaxID=688607 RepID=UPI0027D22102|nr:superkiller complex protein 8-like [Achroia grisella]
MPTTSMYSILLKKENAHDDPIYTCAWVKTNTTGNPNDIAKDFIVTGGLDGLVKIWLFNNNKLNLVHNLVGHSMAVVSVAVSPDGYTIASSSLDSSIIIWDLVSGNKVYEVQTGATETWKVTFSPSGTQIASGGHTGKIIIYSVEKGKPDKILDTRGKFALSVAWSADGKYIASGAMDGTVSIMDVAQGKLLHTIEAHTQSVRSVAFSPNSQLLTTASNDGNVKIYNVASANPQSKLLHNTWALCANISSDGTRVATAAADGRVRVAQLDGLKVLNEFHEHTDTVWCLQFNASGDKLVSVSKDKCINIYECPLPPKKR